MESGIAATKKAYYPAIDGLRAFSAIAVVLVHVLQNSPYNLSGDLMEWVIRSSFNVIFLFMIIGGFSMCCGYYEKIIGGLISLSSFYSKRFWKIWPLFALISLAEFLVSPGTDTLYELVANLTLLFGFTGERMSVTGVGWYIGATVIFYLIFPFFCTLLSSQKKAWLAFAAAFAINRVASVRFGLNCDSFAYDFVFFMTGGLIFLYKDTLTEFSRKYRLLIPVLCTVLTAWCYFTSLAVWKRILIYSLCLIYALGSGRKLLDNPVTHFLAGISLEIYLCHMVVFRVIQKLGLSMLFGDGWLSFLFTSAVVLAVSIAGPLVLQKLLGFLLKKLPRSSVRAA